MWSFLDPSSRENSLRQLYYIFPYCSMVECPNPPSKLANRDKFALQTKTKDKYTHKIFYLDKLT